MFIKGSWTGVDAGEIYEKFEDTKVLIRSRYKKERQCKNPGVNAGAALVAPVVLLLKRHEDHIEVMYLTFRLH
jgi:hypothetical protein